MALSTESPRLHFEPDSIPLPANPSTEQAPALSSSSALARFEFESGRGNEGTKILMVEWEDEDEGADGAKNMGDWEVSWEGKSTTLSARDGAEDKLHRLYFLLAPGASIPRIVKLSQVGGKKHTNESITCDISTRARIDSQTSWKKRGLTYDMGEETNICTTKGD